MLLIGWCHSRVSPTWGAYVLCSLPDMGYAEGVDKVRAYSITIWVDVALSPDEVREAVERVGLPGMQIDVREIMHG